MSLPVGKLVSLFIDRITAYDGIGGGDKRVREAPAAEHPITDRALV